MKKQPKNKVAYSELKETNGLFYHDGKPFSGVGVERWNDKQIKKEITFKDGKMDGFSREWHQSGKPFHEVHYKNGRLDGVVKVFSLNGSVMADFIFKDGKQVKEKFSPAIEQAKRIRAMKEERQVRKSWKEGRFHVDKFLKKELKTTSEALLSQAMEKDEKFFSENFGKSKQEYISALDALITQTEIKAEFYSETLDASKSGSIVERIARGALHPIQEDYIKNKGNLLNQADELMSYLLK